MRTVIKARNDPVWFVNEILGITLFPKQEEILRDFYAYKYDPSLPQNKYLIIVAGMRSGKSLLASIVCAYEFFINITLDDPATHYGLVKGQPIFITTVSTSSTLASDGIFYNLSNYVEHVPFFKEWFDIKIKEERIECRDKNVICQVLGSWTTTMAGRTNAFICVDEVDLFEQATHGKRSGWEVWATLRNSTATLGDYGHCMAISSPKFTNGVIMSLYKDMQKDSRAVCRLYETWVMNPKPECTFEALKKEHRTSMHTFWRDFGCKPEIAGGMAFPEGVRLTHIPNVLKTFDRPTTVASRVMAIDPAVRNDAFGIACGYRDVVGNIIIDGVHKFEKMEGDPYIKPSEVEEFIFRQIPRLNVNAFVYDVWLFPNIIESIGNKFGLREENECCLKHIVSKEDYDRWRGLQDNPSDYTLSVVYDETLEREVNDLVIVSGESQKPRVDHQSSSSKDQADCVANCIWYLTTKQMIPMKPDIFCIRTF